MSDICRELFEKSIGIKPDATFTYNKDSNQYVAVDFEMSCQVDDFNEQFELWCKAWQIQADELNAVKADLQKSQDTCKQLNQRIESANDVYGVIQKDWAFVCHGTFGDLIHLMMGGLNPITRTDFIVGDYVFMKDSQNKEMWIITRISEDGCIELKTALYGYPVPERCWGMYYQGAEGIRHASPQEKLNKRRED